MRKQLAAMGMALAMTASLAGYAPAEETTEAPSATVQAQDPATLLDGKKIVYIANEAASDWQVISTTYLQALVEEAGGQCTIYNPENDASRQAQMVDDCIVAKPDVLVIKPIDQAAIIPALQRVNEAGIPIITLDTGILEDADVEIMCSIQTDQTSLGAVDAQYVLDKAQETGEDAKIITVLGDMASNIAQMRQKGFNDLIEQSDHAEILAQTEAKWDASAAYTAVKDMLTAHPDANTLFVCSDSMMIGALQALNDDGKEIPIGEEGHMTVVGIDCDPNGCKAVEEGYVDQEAEHNSALHSDIAFKVIVDYLNGYDIPETIFFETTARNIDNVADAWGNLDVDNVASWGWMDEDVYTLQTPVTK